MPHPSTTEPLLSAYVAGVGIRSFGVDEVFFSTTDPRGVIRHVNATFVRLAGYDVDALRGAAHNIVRDPGMPRGAFQLVWEELAAGRPVAAYVTNRASDGARYEVLAAITPTTDGYLSVRVKPLDTALHRDVLALYDRARAAEDAARDEGAGAHAAALVGREVILAGLAEGGIADMAAFTRAVLPRELALFLDASAGIPDPAGADEALGTVLLATRFIARMLRTLLGRLGELDALAARAKAESEAVRTRAVGLRELRVAVAEATAAVAEADAAVTADIDDAVAPAPADGSGPADLDALAADILQRIDVALAGLDALPATLGTLRRAVHDLAQELSLFALQNRMIAVFAAELVDGRDVEPPGEAVRTLHDALVGQTSRLECGIRGVLEVAASTPVDLGAAVAGVDRARRRITRWHDGIRRRLPADSAAALLADEAARHSSEGFSWLDEPVRLAAATALVEVPFDAAALRLQLGLIGATAAALD